MTGLIAAGSSGFLRCLTLSSLIGATACHAEPAAKEAAPEASEAPSTAPPLSINVERGAEPLPSPALNDAADSRPPTLGPRQGERLRRWYAAVGPRRPHESFGELVIRAAQQQLGKPYTKRPRKRGVRRQRISLASYRCVSLVEHSLAVAQCTWLNQRDEACFVREVQAWRYRDGIPNGYGSRLHYFTDWIGDNTQRGRLRSLTEELGGEPIRQVFNFMTTHPRRYRSLAAPEVAAQVRASEVRLSAGTVWVLPAERVEQAQAYLQSGDVLAFAGDKPGLLVTHTGLVLRDEQGLPRVLHASTRHRKVVLGPTVAQYVARRASPRGLLVLRPQAPQVAVLASQIDPPPLAHPLGHVGPALGELDHPQRW